MWARHNERAVMVDFSLTTPQMTAMLEYVHTGKIDKTNKIVVGMNETIDKAYEQEDWVSDMNGTDFDHLAWKAEGREEGRASGLAEGRTVERKREAALLQAMNARGCSLEDFATAITNDDLDTLYREYGIECE